MSGVARAATEDRKGQRWCAALATKVVNWAARQRPAEWHGRQVHIGTAWVPHQRQERNGRCEYYVRVQWLRQYHGLSQIRHPIYASVFCTGDEDEVNDSKIRMNIQYEPDQHNDSN
jgi:hypothetical protein